MLSVYLHVKGAAKQELFHFYLFGCDDISALLDAHQESFRDNDIDRCLFILMWVGSKVVDATDTRDRDLIDFSFFADLRCILQEPFYRKAM